MEAFALFEPYRTISKNVKDISRYVAESIMNIYGVIVTVDLGKYYGLTAKQVAKEVLLEYGLPEAEIDARLDRYMEDLAYSYYNVAWSDTVLVNDGARELIDELISRGVKVGIATGEAERVAKMRLEKAGLKDKFEFGSFGEADLNFDIIIQKAKRSAAERYNILDENGTFLTNSVKEIQAAKKASIYTIGVANDICSESDLAGAGADLVVKSLKEKGKIIDGILRGE